MSGDRGSGRSRRRRNRPIGQAIRSASPELRPTATARIDAAQSGRLSMVSSPVTLTGGHLAHDLITGLLTTAGVRLYRGTAGVGSPRVGRGPLLTVGGRSARSSRPWLGVRDPDTAAQDRDRNLLHDRLLSDDGASAAYGHYPQVGRGHPELHRVDAALGAAPDDAPGYSGGRSYQTRPSLIVS